MENNKNHKLYTALFGTERPLMVMVFGGVIAAIYVALTLVFAPISFGAIQFRISELLCVLPYFTGAAVPGLAVGCFLANLLSGAAWMDVVFGTIATLIGAVGSRLLAKRSKWLVCVPPIVSNTIIIPWVLRYAYGVTELIPVAMLTVGIGEVLAVGVLGNLLLTALERVSRTVFHSHMA